MHRIVPIVFRRGLEVLLPLPDHAAHAVFRFKRLGFQKRECLCLCAARQENSDRGGDQNDQYAEANTSRCIFRDVGGIFAQSAEQDQRNG